MIKKSLILLLSAIGFILGIISLFCFAGSFISIQGYSGSSLVTLKSVTGFNLAFECEWMGYERQNVLENGSSVGIFISFLLTVVFLVVDLGVLLVRIIKFSNNTENESSTAGQAGALVTFILLLIASFTPFILNMLGPKSAGYTAGSVYSSYTIRAGGGAVSSGVLACLGILFQIASYVVSMVSNPYGKTGHSNNMNPESTMLSSSQNAPQKHSCSHCHSSFYGKPEICPTCGVKLLWTNNSTYSQSVQKQYRCPKCGSFFPGMQEECPYCKTKLTWQKNKK